MVLPSYVKSEVHTLLCDRPQRQDNPLPFPFCYIKDTYTRWHVLLFLVRYHQNDIKNAIFNSSSLIGVSGENSELRLLPFKSSGQTPALLTMIPNKETKYKQEGHGSVTCSMSLWRCNVCIKAAFREGTPALFVYSAILSFIPVSWRRKTKPNHEMACSWKKLTVHMLKEPALTTDVYLQKHLSNTHISISQHAPWEPALQCFLEAEVNPQLPFPAVAQSPQPWSQTFCPGRIHLRGELCQS